MDMEETFKKQIMDLYEHTLSLAKLNNDLMDRVKKLESERSLEVDFVTDSLVWQTVMLLAEDFPVYKERMIELCDIMEPPDHIDKAAVNAGLKKFIDHLQDPDKKSPPAWFKGIIQGGKKEESE